MKRDIEQSLLQWKNQPNPIPLLVRGARQVGKTFAIETFGQEHFEHMVVINFELQPEMIACFDKLDPLNILKHIFLLTGQRIEPSKTLLFLDEIQDCPNAIRALRYFKEKLPQLHVIGAGSLLEFTLNDANFRMPVGRVQSLYMKPLSFKEYLSCSGNQALRDWLETIHLDSIVEPHIHEHLLTLVREYMILGGMPAVLQAYFPDRSDEKSQQIQTLLLNTYRQDFGKYAKNTDHRHLRKLFEKIPGLISETFKYAKVDPDTRSREIKTALELLKNAGLVHQIYSTAASCVPLASTVNEKRFKVLFLDIGLVTRSGKLSVELLLNHDILLINRGMLAEQFVGQELLAYSSPFEEGELYFWAREKSSSMAEVDYVINIDAKIIPIEVKAGKTGHLKSLKLFMQEQESALGVRFSQQTLNYHDQVLSLPLYLVSEMPRLIHSVIDISHDAKYTMRNHTVKI